MSLLWCNKSLCCRSILTSNAKKGAIKFALLIVFQLPSSKNFQHHDKLTVFYTKSTQPFSLMVKLGYLVINQKFWQDMAEHLNNFLTSIGKNLQETIPPTADSQIIFLKPLDKMSDSIVLIAEHDQSLFS